VASDLSCGVVTRLPCCLPRDWALLAAMHKSILLATHSAALGAAEGRGVGREEFRLGHAIPKGWINLGNARDLHVVGPGHDSASGRRPGGVRSEMRVSESARALRAPGVTIKSFALGSAARDVELQTGSVMGPVAHPRT